MYKKEVVALLELAILGFLKEGRLHGYELKRHIAMLTGHYRPVSDGALYPAIARLEREGLLTRRTEPGRAGVERRTLELTAAGEAELMARIRQPEDLSISDRSRFFTMMAFLHYLSPAEQREILLRRRDFIRRGRSFFQQEGRPITKGLNYYRESMIRLAKATSRNDLEWLEEALARLDKEEKPHE